MGMRGRSLQTSYKSSRARLPERIRPPNCIRDYGQESSPISAKRTHTEEEWVILQPHLFFTLAEPRVLVLAVLCSSITGYLFTLRDKSQDLQFLVASFSCWTAHFSFAVLVEAVYPLSPWFSVAQMFFGLAGLVLFVGFAYCFRGGSLPARISMGSDHHAGRSQCVLLPIRVPVTYR
jgi:hypothetical protein